MSVARYQTAQAAAETPRSLQARAFGFVNKGLEMAADETERLKALHKNHQLWSILLGDLASEGNQLPAPLRAQLISLGLWSMRYSLRAMSEPLSLAPLMEVNRNIAAGLAEQDRAMPAGAAEASDRIAARA